MHDTAHPRGGGINLDPNLLPGFAAGSGDHFLVVFEVSGGQAVLTIRKSGVPSPEQQDMSIAN